IGLRSTRIRTPDRTSLSVPNGQIANVSIETISARDMFWFHHSLGLPYQTTPAQLRAVADGLVRPHGRHPAVGPQTARGNRSRSNMTEPFCGGGAFAQRFGQLPGAFASAIVRLGPDEIDAAIADFLGQLGEDLDADRVALVSTPDRTPLKSWVRPGAGPAD